MNPEATGPLPRPRVLVIEDDTMTRRSIARVLAEYEVIGVETRRDALAQYAAIGADMVVTDYQLPDGTGADLIAELRSQAPHLPILLMSGAVDLGEIAESLGFGADALIEKPFTGERLRDKVSRMLASTALRVEMAGQQAELNALHRRRDEEAAAAAEVLDRMLARGDFDPSWIRSLVRPADRFAGDAVFAETRADRQRWMLTDVAGHTLASALVTIPVSMLFYHSGPSWRPLRELLGFMDRELARLLPVQLFCSATVCELDRARGLLWVWNGGMPDLLLRRASGTVERVASTDLPLGIEATRTSHEVVSLPVAPGDRVYVFSDGVAEAADVTGAMLGMAPLIDALAGGPAETALDRALYAWRTHVHGAWVEDDASFVEVIV